MDIASLYQSKLTMPNQAVASIPSGSKLSMGMAMAEPPMLLKALADRAEAGGIEDLKVYYFEATKIAGGTILRYELNDRIDPYCMFIAAAERALIKRGVEDGGRKIVNYVPNNFSIRRRGRAGSTRSALTGFRALHRLVDGPARLFQLRHRQRLFDQSRPRGQAAHRRGQRKYATRPWRRGGAARLGGRCDR